MFTREEIINGAWDENTHITDRTVDVHISRLRKSWANMLHLLLIELVLDIDLISITLRNETEF